MSLCLMPIENKWHFRASLCKVCKVRRFYPDQVTEKRERAKKKLGLVLQREREKTLSPGGGSEVSRP